MNIHANKGIPFPWPLAIELKSELTKEEIKNIPSDVYLVIQQLLIEKIMSLSPKHLARCSRISKSINRMITEDNQKLRSLWHQHCVHRWGASYVLDADVDKCKLSIYGRLYQLEKAAFRHLSLLNNAEHDILEVDPGDDDAALTLVNRYLQGASPKAAWLYLYGCNLLDKDNFLTGLDYLKEAANKGSVEAAESLVFQYLKNPGLKNRFEHAIGYMLKAVEKHSERAKDALKLIQEDKWTKGLLTRLTETERVACKAALNKALEKKVKDIV